MPLSKKEREKINSNTEYLNNAIKRKAGKVFSFGSALAMVISWTTNKSILWAILHGLLNWFYVVYYWVGFGN